MASLFWFLLHNAKVKARAAVTWQKELRAVCAGPLFNHLLGFSFMTYESWRISYQDGEQAARSAFAEMERLQGFLETLEVEALRDIVPGWVSVPESEWTQVMASVFGVSP